MSFLSRLECWSQPQIISVCFVALLVVTWGDYATGYEVAFLTFYFIPIALASWYVNLRFAVVMAILCTCGKVFSDLAAGKIYLNNLIPIWNALIILSCLLVVVWLIRKIRQILMDLEETVQARTRALEAEIRERELLEKELLEISEHEQRRIGHDLHDSLCQHLAATAMAGQVLVEKFERSTNPVGRELRHLAGRMIGMVEEGIDLTRRLARGLSPVALDSHGLMSALEEFAHTITIHFGTECIFECESPILIHDSISAIHLYRIAQEAVTNSIKHGKAKLIRIELQQLDEQIVLKVYDNGIGLDATGKTLNGMGTRIMAHRSAIIGAKFNLATGPEGWTVATCVYNNKHQ